MKSEIACQYTGMFTKDQLCDTIDVKTTAVGQILNIDLHYIS